MKKKKQLLLFDVPTLIDMKKHSREDLSIFLTNPQVPYGVLSLASYLQHKNIAEVKVISLDTFLFRNRDDVRHHDGSAESITRLSYTVKKIIDKLITELNPDMIGISVTGAMKVYPTNMLVNIFKKFYPQIPIIIGGHHVTMNIDLYTKSAYKPDAIVIGEAELVMAEWLENNLKMDCKIPGLILLSKNGEIINGGRRKMMSESEISYPVDFKLLHLPAGYEFKNLGQLFMYSRGCTGFCSFCTTPFFWKGKVRFKDIEVVKKEVQQLANYGVDFVDPMDSTTNLSETYFKDFCKVLKNYSNIVFIGRSRLDTITKEEINLMSKSNIKYLDIGIETMDAGVLDDMHKGIKELER